MTGTPPRPSTAVPLETSEGADVPNSDEGSTPLLESGVEDKPARRRKDRLALGSRRIAPLASAVVAWIWVFRDVFFRGELLGNLGDARWTVAVHEHWYRVWQGLDSIRNLQYFFPLQQTLGTSDAFFVQGQLYSIARLLGLGFVDSWVVAQAAFFLIGALGVAALSTRLLASTWARSAFTVLTCASYPVVLGVGHVQVIGFLATSWVFVGVIDVCTGRQTKRGIALIAVVPPLLALSSWYAMVLSAVVLGFLGAIGAIVAARSTTREQLRRRRTEVRAAVFSLTGGILAACFLVGWAAVLWVYLPSQRLLPPTGWLEVVLYSPRWSDILNASEGGGGLWSPVYAELFDPASANYEQKRGFTPILFAAFLVFGLLQIRRPARGDISDRLPGRLGVVAAWLTVLAVLGFFVVDERTLSLYRFVWFTVPGLDSIRAPFRVQAILYGLAIFVVLRAMELCWARAFAAQVPRARRVVAGGLSVALVIVIAVEMIRPTFAEWTRDQFLPRALLDQVPVAQQSCDAVIVTPGPSGVTAVEVVDAVIFSMVAELPTPQGYGRGDPLGYPGSADGGAELVEWMRGQGFDGRVCRVTSESVEVIGSS